MNEQHDKFEKLLREQLADHHIDPPADAWERIASSMAEIDAAATPPITIAPHRRQRLGLRRAWQYGIAAMLLLSIGLIANRLTKLAPQPDQSELMADAIVLYEPAEDKTHSTAPLTELAEQVAPKRAQIAQKTVLKSGQSGDSDGYTTHIELNLPDLTTSDEQDSKPQTDVKSNHTEQSQTKTATGATTSTTTREQFQKRLQEVISEGSSKRRGGRITTSLYAANISRTSNNQPSPLRLAEAGMVTTEVLNSSHGEVIEKLTDPEASVRYQPDTELNHHVPFTVGVGVQYELTERWALETGVNYTYLHSTATSEGTFTYKTSQELHYIGIPLSASYKFVNGERFEMYARAGGAVERAVAANKILKMGTSDGNSVNRTKQPIKCQGVQLSASAGIGAELKLTHQVGLYAEVGAGYFFDNNQPISYRTDNPLSLTLQAGARIHFGTKQ